MTKEQAIILRQARTAKGIYQKDLAKSLNIDVSIIKDYECCTVKNFNKRIYNNILAKLGVKT